MERFLAWLIHMLGGRTNKEYITVCDQRKEFAVKCEALNTARDHIFRWFDTPIMRVEMRGEKYNAIVTASLDDTRVPVEYLKRNLCDMFARKLFDDGLVSYDLHDDVASGKKMYRATITLMLPSGFGREQK